MHGRNYPNLQYVQYDLADNNLTPSVEMTNHTMSHVRLVRAVLRTACQCVIHTIQGCTANFADKSTVSHEQG